MLYFVCIILESFKKVFMYCLVMDSITVYYIIIISNTLKKVADCIELRIATGWLI